MKKNQHARHHNERKKKTRSEITQGNKMKNAMSFQKEKKAGDPRWDDLHGLHASCRNALGAAAPVSQLFVNKDLITAMGDNVTKLRDLASILNKDVKDFVEALNQISESHKDKTGPVDDPNDLMMMLTIGEQYHKWTAAYESVVLPTIRDIFALTNSFLPNDQKVNPGA